MPSPVLSLGDQLGALLAQVPELVERVERLERENARLRARESQRDPLAQWYDVKAFTAAYPQLFSMLRKPETRLRRQCAEGEANGLAAANAIRKTDGQWYVHASRYADWIDRQQRGRRC